jgi:hypothetical protein
LLGNNTRDFIIEKHIAQHFVQYSQYLLNSLPSIATQMIKLLLNLKFSANDGKGEEF